MIYRIFTTFITILSISFSLSAQEYPKEIDLKEKIIQNQNMEEKQIENLNSSTVYRLDSVIEKSYYDVTGQFVNDIKNVFSFNNDNDVTLWMKYSTDPVTGEWINFEKEEYYYDQQGNEIKHISYQWDELDGSWEADSKSEQTYNSFNDLSQRVYFNWDTVNNSWLPDLKTNFSYDSVQNNTEQNYNIWNETAGSWDKYFIRQYTYDTNNNPTSKIRVFWSEYSGDYLYSNRDDYFYNNDKLLVQSKAYDGDTVNNQWIIESKLDFSYNSENNLSQRIYYKMQSTWEPHSKTEYTYDSAQNQSLRASFEWNESSSQWTPYTKLSRVHDSYNNILEETYTYWDNSGNYWIDTEKEERSFDNSVSYSELLIFEEFHDKNISFLVNVDKTFNHKLNTRQTFENVNTTNTLVNDELENYYYTELSSVNENKTTENIRIYPNPASDNIIIISDNKITGVKIINSEGRNLINENLDLKNKLKLDIGNLSKGLYFVTLITNNRKIITKQFIKH